ncbi:unnamed protein product [Symbiodinium sp. KB8]|nr:unnamed protein product [Symbiodinium sp. KB8]
MSITESEARAQKLGLSADVLQLVVDGGVNTLAKFAYVSSFIPGQSDETPFVTALKELLKRDATVGELSVFRRLHSESYALVAAELKAQVERTTDAPARSLAAPDRADDETRNSRDKEDRTLTVDNSGNVHIKNADIKGERLLHSRYREVPAGYVRVSIQQLLQVTAAGRPLDAVWMRCADSSEVRMPDDLKDGHSCTTKGVPICFDAQRGKCTRQLTGNKCFRGAHVCCFCFQPGHFYPNCPKRKKE